MRSNSQLRYHAEKIISTFGKIIEDIDADLSKSKEMLIELGAKHYHYDVKYDFFRVNNYIRKMKGLFIIIFFLNSFFKKLLFFHLSKILIIAKFSIRIQKQRGKS
jgi:hypothetical protein